MISIHFVRSSFDNLVAYGIKYELRYGVQFEFAHYVCTVSVYGLSADAKNRGRLPGPVTPGNQTEHISLARRQKALAAPSPVL